METLPFYSQIDAVLERILALRKESEGDSLIAKYFITQLSFAVLLIISLIVVALIVKAEILVQYGLILCALPIIGWPTFFFVKKLEYVILFMKLFTLFVTILFIFRMGGILSSGGIILIAIQTVTHTIIFRNYRWMLSVYTIFIAGISLLFFLTPVLPSDNILSQSQNLLVTFMNLIGVTTFIFIFAMYVVKLYSDLEKQETLRQKEINNAKTRLYSNITHEFRTPLTVILGLADSLKTQLQEVSKIDTIVRNGKNLLQLIDQMLDLSKLESGNMSVNKIHGNIIPFLRYIFQLQEYYAQEKDLKMTFKAESQSYELDFDPEKTTTIVSNLLSNAIKFTPSGGEINMYVKSSDSYISIIIKDNGIGIPKQLQDKIFDRFYQGDDKNTRKAGGTGIGLALTKELVNLLNGSIQLKSYPGIETVFTVKLPISSQFKKVEIPEEVHEFRNDELRINSDNESVDKQHLLIIEDNNDVINYLISCYKNNFNISTTSNGKDGLELALKEIPDIVVSDVMMPEMDGFELCKTLKNDYRTSHIPIILLTAKADIPSRIEGLEQGADAYVVKPFNQQELLVRMQKLLELRNKLFKRYSSEDLTHSSSDPIIQKEDLFFSKLTSLIKDNLSNDDFGVQNLCTEMAMSKSQLYRKFKALTNRSIAKFIRTVRLQLARQLLETTNMSITEIAYEVGMKSLSTFSQLFKEEFGESPKAFTTRIHTDSTT